MGRTRRTGFVVLALLVAGCGTGPWTGGPTPVPTRPAPTVASPSATPSPTPSVTPSPTASATPSPTASPTVSPTASPSPSTSPSMTPSRRPTSDALRQGDEGAAVLALQRRLSDLGYWLGTPDGTFGTVTKQAVYALQKAAGLSRDGVAGPRTSRALADGLRPHARSTSGRVVEIDLDRQLLMLVQDGRVRWVLSTSTGSGHVYYVDGRARLAVTPRGHFQVYAEIDGMRHSDLGFLWRPKYFRGGVAVHGYDSVPPWPASHGCVRVSDAAIDWIWATGQMPIGTPVWVY